MMKRKILGIALGLIVLLLVLGHMIKVDPPEGAIDYSDTMFIGEVYMDHYKYASTFYGIEEKFTDGRSNPVVLSLYEEFADWVSDSEVPWCSAFVNSIMASTGYEYSGKLNARSWVDVGEEVDKRFVQPGDVVVLWRSSPSSWKGHVGFFVAYTPDMKYIWILGGNQGNRVTIAKYPASRLLCFKRPKKIRDDDGVMFMDGEPKVVELKLTQ